MQALAPDGNFEYRTEWLRCRAHSLAIIGIGTRVLSFSMSPEHRMFVLSRRREHTTLHPAFARAYSRKARTPNSFLENSLSARIRTLTYCATHRTGK